MFSSHLQPSDLFLLDLHSLPSEKEGEEAKNFDMRWVEPLTARSRVSGLALYYRRTGNAETPSYQ